MNDLCSIELLRNAVARVLSADEEATLHAHLEHCEACCAQMEQLAGGDAWQQEAASLLSTDELDATVPDAAAWSEVDFTVEHLDPSDDANVLGQLGGYDVLAIVGRGGMGVVLKAFDRELKRYVAIKVLAPHLAHSSVARKRFAREAQAAAAVVNPHVIAIHHVQPTGRLPFLIMPLLTGESLAQRLKARGPLELTEVLRIGMQAAAGLAAAHDQGLVHRDVKPANIFLEKGVERVVITDFGLARAADDVSMTRQGVVAGTPEYMSPEQARGEALDGRSDLFSLGCVLYEMATGVSPFRTDSTIATLRRIVDEQPAAIASLAPELPPWFSRIVERLLSKVPAQRSASASEVSQLLEQCLSHLQQPTSVPLPALLVPHAAGRRSFFNVTRKGVFAMLGTIGMALLGMVLLQPTEAPDIAGQWLSDDWGTVVLEEVPRRHEVFAPWDGKVIEVRVENGQAVKQGEIVLVLRSDDLDARLITARKLVSEAKSKLKDLNLERTRAVDAGRPDEVTRIDTEIAATEAQRDEAIDKTAVLQKRIEALQIPSPVDGAVATLQVKQNLLDRPVRRGDRLLEIMKADGPREYEGTFSGSGKNAIRSSDRPVSGTDKLPDSIKDGIKIDVPAFGPNPTFNFHVGIDRQSADKDKSGTLQLKWSRVERRFNGTWKVGDDRNGKLSLRLVGDEIRGAWSTSKKSTLATGTARLSEFAWSRSRDYAASPKLPYIGKLLIGKIERVDLERGVAWIDLGTVDSVKVGMRFQVHAKATEDLKQDEPPLKGSVEVIRILDQHLSEVRILKEDLKDKLTVNDEVSGAIRPVIDPKSLTAAAARFNAETAEVRSTLFAPPIPDLTVERLREGFRQSANYYRGLGKRQVADALEKIAESGQLPQAAMSELIASGVHAQDANGQTISRQVVPALVLPDDTTSTGTSLVVLRPLELIYRKEGPISKDYGDQFHQVQDDLEGVWGLALPPEIAAKRPEDQRLRWVIAGGWQGRFQGDQRLSASRLKVEPQHKPKRLAFVDGEGKPMRGIYEVKEDGLRLSIAPETEALPTKFGTEHPEFKRVKGKLAEEQLAALKLYSTKAATTKHTTPESAVPGTPSDSPESSKTRPQPLDRETEKGVPVDLSFNNPGTLTKTQPHESRIPVRAKLLVVKRDWSNAGDKKPQDGIRKSLSELPDTPVSRAARAQLAEAGSLGPDDLVSSLGLPSVFGAEDFASLQSWLRDQGLLLGELPVEQKAEPRADERWTSRIDLSAADVAGLTGKWWFTAEMRPASERPDDQGVFRVVDHPYYLARINISRTQQVMEREPGGPHLRGAALSKQPKFSFYLPKKRVVAIDWNAPFTGKAAQPNEPLGSKVILIFEDAEVPEPRSTVAGFRLPERIGSLYLVDEGRWLSPPDDLAANNQAAVKAASAARHALLVFERDKLKHPPIEFRIAATKADREADGVTWFPIIEPRIPAPAGQSGANVPIEEMRDEKWRGLLSNKTEHTLLADGTWRVVNCEVARSAQSTDLAPQFEIQVKLDAVGGALLRRLTSAHLNQSLAIVVDGTIVVAPVIRNELGEDFVITGNFSKAAAENLAASIRKPDLRKRVTFSLRFADAKAAVAALKDEAARRKLRGFEATIDPRLNAITITAADAETLEALRECLERLDTK